MLRMAATLVHFTLAILVAWTLIAITNIIYEYFVSDSSCLPLAQPTSLVPWTFLGIIMD